jgi:hypothetical protein
MKQFTESMKELGVKPVIYQKLYQRLKQWRVDAAEYFEQQLQEKALRESRPTAVTDETLSPGQTATETLSSQAATTEILLSPETPTMMVPINNNSNDDDDDSSSSSSTASSSKSEAVDED